jgi:hypothetical protein
MDFSHIHTRIFLQIAVEASENARFGDFDFVAAELRWRFCTDCTFIARTSSSNSRCRFLRCEKAICSSPSLMSHRKFMTQSAAAVEEIYLRAVWPNTKCGRNITSVLPLFAGGEVSGARLSVCATARNVYTTSGDKKMCFRATKICSKIPKRLCTCCVNKLVMNFDTFQAFMLRLCLTESASFERISQRTSTAVQR